MLTPHVLKDDAAYSKMSEDEIKRMEQLRVGVRKGMMPWGRERLAEGEYEKALAELKKDHPNNQKVLWHLDCATNLNPTFLEAMELKQRTTGREVSVSDNSSIRSFVQNAILAEREPGAPVPPGTRTGDEKSPAAKPGNPTASLDKDAEELAQNDLSEELPLDGDEEDYEAQPEADTVVTAPKPATTQPSTPATATATADKPVVSEKKSTDDGSPKVTVTELPTEEVKPDAPTPDDNK
jgi:hypothetical protein